jgi:hypothetical protein
MTEIRKLTKQEIQQAEILSTAVAGCMDEVCGSEGIDNFGVITAAFLIIFASLVIECLAEDEREGAVQAFFNHVNDIVKTESLLANDQPAINPQIN